MHFRHRRPPVAPVTPFERLGAFVYRRRWWVIAAWAAVLLAAVPFAPRAGDPLQAGGFTLDDLESARTRAVLARELGETPSALAVVYHSDELAAGSQAFEAAAASAIANVPSARHVAGVVSHVLAPRQVSADGHTAYDIVQLDLSPDDSPESLPFVRAALGPAPGLEVSLAGGPAFSGVTVLLGLAGLVLFEFMVLRSVGIAGAIVVALAISSALTLLPALLSVLGPRLDAFAVRRVRPGTGTAGRWARLAHWVMDRPVAVLVPTLAILLLLGVPFLHVRFNAPDATILPAGVPSRASYDLLASTFGEGEFAPLELAIRTTGPATSPANLERLYDYSRRLAADPRVTRVESLVDVDPRVTLAQYQLIYANAGGPRDRYAAIRLEATTRGDLTAFTLFTPYGPNRDEARDLIRDLRASSGLLAPPPGMTVGVTGGAADVVDVVSRIGADFPRTGLFLLVTPYL